MNYQRKCKCGKVTLYKCKKTYDEAMLDNTLCKSCSKLGNRNGFYGHFTARPYESIYKRLQRNARRRSIPCLLTYDQYIELIKTPICQFCGEVVKPIEHLKHSEDSICYFIDRLDNNRGYMLDNCCVSCYSCNLMKHKLSVKQFVEHCKKVIEYQTIYTLGGKV